MTAKPPEFDLLIAGAGMVGATLACLLADSGLRVAIADSQPLLDEAVLDEFVPDREPPGFETRVSAITPASQKILQRAGAWQQIASARISPYRQMQVWEADGTGAISFDADEVRVPVLGHIVENRLITASLHRQLRQHAGITLLPAAGVSAFDRRLAGIPGQEYLAVGLADGSECSTRLLVAADGANSAVRRLAGFDTREWDYAHHAIVTTVRTADSHQQTAIQRFMDDGVLALLPLYGAGEHYCSIVWSVVPEQAARLMALETDDFVAAVDRAIESRFGAVEWADERSCFPLRQRHAKDYVRNNVVLVGDAAHTIHPLAGQGVNLGFQDALALSEVLGRAHDEGRALDEGRVLMAYQRQRKGENLSMMWLMEGFRHLFSDQPLPVRWLRNAGMSGVDSLPLLKQRIMQHAMGVQD